MISVVCVCGGESGVPHDAVESRNAKRVPLRGDPAPELVQRKHLLLGSVSYTHESWTINLSSVFGVYKKVCQGWYKGTPITSNEIFPPAHFGVSKAY